MGAGPGNKSEIDRDAAKKILKILQDNLNELQNGDGSAGDVQQFGNVTAQQLGAGFATAQHLGTNTQSAYTVINGQYNALIQSYQAVINSLNQAVGNHVKSEDENTATVNSVNTSVAPPTPNYGNTSAY
ncbi:hypothetical protein [Actinomadura atramentaria]|uniref:hypothetical protein n=1 Tax=Actinomadura atramentaria TaxID=1990 RepID=UPI000371B07B|nr:hypothetical protein [Actinomadura atramentaria]